MNATETTDDLEVTRRALGFLMRSRNLDRPFALFLSYNNPHDIYHFNGEVDPKPNRPIDLPSTWYTNDLTTDPPVQMQFMTDDQGKVIVDAEKTAWQRYRELYREKVNLYDTELGRVLAVFRKEGLLDNTLVIATSDHGDMDGQHGLIYKGPFMYEHMIRVPLIVRPPGNSRSVAPHSVEFPTVNVDLLPTIAECAGIDIPKTDGLSFKSFIYGGKVPPERDYVIGQYYSKQKWVNPIRMIRTSGSKYNCYRTHGEELYDYDSDPDEIVNHAGDDRYESVRTELSEKLVQWMKQHDDPFDSQLSTTRNGTAIARERPGPRKEEGIDGG